VRSQVCEEARKRIGDKFSRGSREKKGGVAA